MFRISCVILLLMTLSVRAQQPVIVSTDVDHFWQAYDKIRSTPDTLLQQKYLQELYLDKASPGLKALRQVRRYEAKDYLDAIRLYPAFWASLRPTSKPTTAQIKQIKTAIGKLQAIYPALRPSPVYFAVGAFRTNGTISDGKVLIGVEMALSGRSIDTTGLPDFFRTYYHSYHPAETIDLLCTHEYVHTQQKLPYDHLLANSLYEGVAEFVSCLATGKPSTTPSFVFAAQNEQRVKQKFQEDIFYPDRMYNWIWGTNRNELKERDLGYYIGYRTAETYYTNAADKKRAIAEMIEMDYGNDSVVTSFMNRSGYFDKPYEALLAVYESKRPKIVEVLPLSSGTVNIPAGVQKFTLRFSKPMNKHNTGIDFGPLGEDYCPKIPAAGRVWSEDGQSWSFDAELQPGRRYQFVITANFRMADGTRLVPYVLDFTTAK
ncbi:Ig-like domain-containing protein [Terrimonas ferruginea]|uniref:Ig-like domain-containing protein n=1 Tax=Terrimonas ferruginea TaxID=249 RepID=UPI0012DC8F83|nr:Ig-like domain-containing protein [Terrimonas ferruginea]